MNKAFRTWFLKLAALVLALTLTVMGWLTYVMQHPGRLTGSIAGTMPYKVQLLQQTAGTPRVIFAGGSSSPYGTNCAMAAEALGMPAIDIGATAYLGLDFYLKTLETYAVAGDIIVLAPEHSQLSGACVDYSLVWQALQNDADTWRCLPVSYLPGLLRASEEYLGSKKASLAADAADIAYNTDFGPLGDVTLARRSLLESGWNTQDPVFLSPDALDGGRIAAINAFAAKMEKRHVRVYFAFAPLDALCIQTDESAQQAYADTVTAELTIPVILPLGEATLPAEYFYDSNNHLTTDGAAINTQNLIAGLRAAGV